MVNNLPAYLAIEPAVAASHSRLLALLVGTNLGPLITALGLAGHTALARTLPGPRRPRVVAPIPPGGLALVPVLLLATTGALAITN